MAVTAKIDPVRLRAWRLFLEAHARVVDRLGRELEAERDLPLTWYEVLLYLDRNGGRLRMHELAESLLLSRSATTRFVDRIEDAGLVARMTCPSDRRGTFVVLTDEGRVVFRGAAPVHLRGIDEHFTRHLTTEEAGAMAAALERVLAAAEE